MIILHRLFFLLSFVLITNCSYAKNEDNTQGQFVKPSKKQVKPTPLDGMYMKEDIVPRLSKTLREIGNDELGLTQYQEILDKYDFINIPDETDNALNNLADSINIKLQDFLNILEKCLNSILPILEKTTKKDNSNDDDDDNNNNYTIDKKINNEKLMNICKEIDNELVLKLPDNRLKNLHILPLFVKEHVTICGQAGPIHNIGSLFLSKCDRKKNVIVIMEQGNFMSEDDISLARSTAKTIVDMLTDSDFVKIIGLAGHGFIHCKNDLIKTTDVNKIKLINHIDNTNKFDTNETLNIDFNELTKNLEDDVVVIHVTNKHEDVSKIEKIKTKKFKIDLRTVLIISDLKSSIGIDNVSQSSNIITLPSNNILGYDISRLFSTLECPTINKRDYYLSDAYLNQYTKTMSLSITRVTETVLISLDIKLRELVQDITYFNAGTNSRAILFDKKGIVLMHKNFPRTEIQQDQPLKVYLHDIENIDDIIVNEMTRKTEGNKSLINKLNKKILIKWKHLKYLDLITCIIIIENNNNNNNTKRPVVKYPPSLTDNIFHHRLDLLSQQSTNIKSEFCINHGNIISPMHSVIYLSPWCLKSTIENLSTAVTLQSYMGYITDSTNLLANPGLGTSVKQDVATLSQTLDYFKQRHNNSPASKFIVRRYVTSVESGVVEIYPGVSLDSSLDPKRRVWYKKSLDYPGKIVLTGPYLDAAGGGYILTLSQTIYEGHHAELHGDNNSIFAISSMDISIGYITRLINDLFPFCHEATVKCFMMDDKGYLVSHPSLLEPGSSKFEQQHLTHKEFLISNDILYHDIFVTKKICANYLDGTIQRYYQFNISIDQVLTNIIHGEHCVKYQIAPIPGTNLFFGVINETCLLNSFCPCSTMNRVCLNCQRMEQIECECPCECSLYSIGCEKSNISSLLEPCPAPFEQGILLQNNRFGRSIESPQLSFNTCPINDCKSYETESECLGIVDCQWCSLDTDGETQLSTPFCSEIASCFRGILGTSLPYTDNNYVSQSIGEIPNADWPAFGPIAAGIVVVMLIFGITLFCYRLHNEQSGLEHQCLHLQGSPDTLRMTHLDSGINGNNDGSIGDQDIIDNERTKNHLDILLNENNAPISPYRVSTNYRRPPGGDSDHGYSTMTPHDDTEQLSFAEPLLLVGGGGGGGTGEIELGKSIIQSPLPTTCLESPHRVLVPVTVHQNMEYC